MDTICSKCGKVLFLDKDLEIPLSVKIFIINLTIKVKVRVRYCANCGFLKVEVKQV